jgi:hypothetical protein
MTILGYLIRTHFYVKIVILNIRNIDKYKKLISIGKEDFQF